MVGGFYAKKIVDKMYLVISKQKSEILKRYIKLCSTMSASNNVKMVLMVLRVDERN